jgi:hypothetical protein
LTADTAWSAHHRTWPERFAWGYIHEMEHFPLHPVGAPAVSGEDGRWRWPVLADEVVFMRAGSHKGNLFEKNEFTFFFFLAILRFARDSVPSKIRGSGFL